MHEFHAVSDLVHHMLEHLAEQNLARVEVVRLRRSPHFTDECIQQAFVMQAAGTKLDGARLEIEPIEATFSCPCGQAGPVSDQDAQAPMVLCPGCGDVANVTSVPDLEVLELR